MKLMKNESGRMVLKEEHLEDAVYEDFLNITRKTKYTKPMSKNDAIQFLMKRYGLSKKKIEDIIDED